MTSKNEMIDLLKAEYPTLKVGNDEDGYIELSAEDYEFTIKEWADARLAKEAKLSLAEAKAQAKAQAEAKLLALGLSIDDLVALGLAQSL